MDVGRQGSPEVFAAGPSAAAPKKPGPRKTSHCKLPAIAVNGVAGARCAEKKPTRKGEPDPQERQKGSPTRQQGTAESNPCWRVGLPRERRARATRGGVHGALLLS